MNYLGGKYSEGREEGPQKSLSTSIFRGQAQKEKPANIAEFVKNLIK